MSDVSYLGAATDGQPICPVCGEAMIDGVCDFVEDVAHQNEQFGAQFGEATAAEIGERELSR